MPFLSLSRRSFEPVRTFAIAIRRCCKRTVATLCCGLSRLAETLYSIGNRTVGRRRVTRVASLVLFACMSLILLGNSTCGVEEDSDAFRAYSHAIKLMSSISLGFNPNPKILNVPAKFEPNRILNPSITGTDGSQTGIANFAGNFTILSVPSSGVFLLARLTDCSLDLITVTSATDPGTVTQHYEQTLHQLASLKTTSDVFPQGCQETSLRASSRPGVFTGLTTNHVLSFAAAGSNGSANAVFLFNSNNGLTTTTDTTLPAASALNTGDLNGDGNYDLVIVNGYNATSASLSVEFGKADGTFGSAVSYPIAGSSASAAVLSDINGDGKLDIVAVSADQQISVLLGNGDGTFQAAKSFSAPVLPGYTANTSTPIASMITADVNGDGKKDVVCSNGLVLLGNGDGTFTAAAAPAFSYVQATSDEGPNLAAGDLNNDGKVDLVLSTGNAVSILLGKGDGTFTQGNSYVSIDSTGFVTVTDLDGDGNLDIYVGLADNALYAGDDSNNTSAYALMGHGDGTFSGAPIAPGTYSGNNLADLNGDGVPDLVSNASGPFGNTISPSFTVALGTGNGGFATKSSVTAPDTFTLNGYSFTGVSKANAAGYALGDVNGDGKPDLVFVGNGLTAQNTGASMAGQSPFPVYFVALGNGDGTFQTPTPYAFPQVAPASGFDNQLAVSSPQIADFNKDGHADLIFFYNDQAGGTGVNPYLQGFVVLAGAGNGTFSTTSTLTSTYGSTSAPATAKTDQITDIADLNGDGVSDLLVVVPSFSVSTGATTQLQVFLGKGDGTFLTPTTVTVAANVYSIPVLADLNGDGKADLAFLTEDASSQAGFAVALGNGNGVFGSATISKLTGGDANRSSGLAAADFDGDGKIDLALIENSGFSGIFYGKGDGTFTSVPESGYIVPKDLINLAAGAPAVAADFNKDGKPDILAGNVVFLSRAAPAVSTPTATSTALTASATSITAGSSVTFTATVTPASGSTSPTGTLTFTDGTTTLGTGTLTSGQATYTTTALSTGAHSITAAYGGDSNFSASTSSAIMVTVNAAPSAVATTTTLSATPASGVAGTAITFAAKVAAASGTAIPTGSVNFLDGTTSIGTQNLDATGNASVSDSALTAGSHSVTAQYAGATGFSGSTSPPVTVTISAPAPDFSLSANPASGTESSSSPATSTLTVTPANGFNSMVSFACSGLPSGLSCGFSPSTVTPAGAAVTTSMSISGKLNAQSSPQHIHPAAPLALCGCGLGLLLLMRMPRFYRLFTGLAFVTIALALATLSGCGSSGSVTKKSQSATVTITATSGSASHSTTYALTANP
jgi:Bacterial Ig-like domain (group 3)/FG-GAP-like repeat